nr:hypothetical protein [Tanacetum cinerariifolium]
FWTSAKVKTVNDDVRLQALVDGKKVIVNEASIRCDLDWMMLKREATEVPHIKPQAKERVPTPSHNPLPSGEDRLKLNELMDICIKLIDRVLSLEKTKTNQVAEIKKLKIKVKKLERKKKKRTHGLKRLYKVGLSAKVESSEDEEGFSSSTMIPLPLSLACRHCDSCGDCFLSDKTTQDQGRIKDQDVFGVHDLESDEVFIDVTTVENVEQNAIVAENVKAVKPKSKGVTIQEPSEFITTLPPQLSQCLQAKDKDVRLQVDYEVEMAYDLLRLIRRQINKGMVVKEIVSRVLKEEGKLELWFEQDIDKEEERFKGDEDGGEMKKRLVEKENMSWGKMIHHHFHQSWHQVKVMRKDDLEW